VNSLNATRASEMRYGRTLFSGLLLATATQPLAAQATAALTGQVVASASQSPVVDAEVTIVLLKRTVHSAMRSGTSR
jgi:hypothetical protein